MIDPIHYEDLEVGSVTCYGNYAVTRDEVIEFASKYDPQPFHLSDEAAAKTYFGRLSASGWHTAAMVMRMLVDNMQHGRPMASLGSPGIDEIRWRKPVYPGDRLRVENQLLSKRRSTSRPDMGLTRSKSTVYNQDDEVVMTLIANGLVRVRHPEVAEGQSDFE